MNKDIIHYDLFGEKLNNGDIVIAADGIRGEIKVCNIIRQTNKMVRVEPLNIKKNKRTFLRYPKYLIKIDKEQAVNYILTLES